VREARAIGSEAAQQVALRELAELCRNLEHTGGAAKRMVVEILDYPSGREIAVIPTKPAGLTRWKALGIAATALATLLGALATFWDSITGHAKP
jgi:hypothetical protein